MVSEVFQTCGALLSFDDHVRALRNCIRAQMAQTCELSDESLMLMFERVIEGVLQQRMQRLKHGADDRENYTSLTLGLANRQRDLAILAETMDRFWPMVFDFLLNDLHQQLNRAIARLSYDELRYVRYRIFNGNWCVQLAMRTIL